MKLFFLLSYINLVYGINILVIKPSGFRYEHRGLDRIAQYLALKNHGVATFQAQFFPEVRQLVMPKLHMVNEYKLKEVLKDDNLIKDIEMTRQKAPWAWDYDVTDYQLPTWKAYSNSCLPILNSDVSEKLKKNRFDVAIIPSGNPCALALIHTLSIPFIYYDTHGYSEDLIYASNTPPNMGALPHSLSTFPYNMSLSQKINNLWLYLYDYLPFASSKLMRSFHRRWSVMDRTVTNDFQNDYEIKKRFPEFPDVNSIKQEAALYFVNSDPLLEYPERAVPPNVVYVGGAHMETPRPLFPPWNTTMSSAKDGVILISFGEFSHSKGMPKHFQDALIHLTKSLPSYRFFWRINEPNLPHYSSQDIPPNVNITQFIPQSDLLGNKHTKLIITHGGMDTLMEAMHCGVPVLGIPLFGNGYSNLRKGEFHKFAVILDKQDLNEASLLRAAKEALKPKYRAAAQEISKTIQDRPLDAFELLIYWTEYIGRHHGNLIRRSLTSPKSFWTTHLYDVTATLAICSFTLTALATKLCSNLIKVLIGGGRREEPENQDTSSPDLKRCANGSTGRHKKSD